VRYKRKEYNKTDLLDGEDEILKRCALIEVLSKNIKSIPSTRFVFLSDSLVYLQEYVNKRSLHGISVGVLRLLINNLAQDLDIVNSTNFVHGDINFCNVIFDGTALCLIDLEPSIFQFKAGRQIIKSGYSFRSSNDVKNNKITFETDKMGFYFFCEKSRNMAIDHFPKYRIPDFRGDDVTSMKIREEFIVKMSFVEIFESVFDIPHA
jgi:hypothetical protein